MAWCGLLGKTLGHSFSPRIHRELADYDYRLLPMPEEELRPFLQTADFSGLNVTIPYKQTVMPMLDELAPEAQEIGAVNTIVRLPDGRLRGHNTDYDGFLYLLRESGLQAAEKKVLVLGSGGASKPVCCACRNLGAREVVVISRSGADNYGNLERHRDAELLVNTTPVGMYPNNGAAPLSLDAFPALEGVLDLIYNPARTALVLQAQDRGLPALGGLAMLVAQAKRAAELFTGASIPDGENRRIYRKLGGELENIVLIGMPGSGKSTIGRLLAKATGRELVDTDAMVEEKAGLPIPEIFARQGEAAFRTLESACIREAGSRSGCVIATGGGVVTRPENRDPLRQNGRLVFLERALEELPTHGRPLSQAHPLAELYAARAPLYQAWADITAKNTGAAETVAAKILEVME